MKNYLSSSIIDIKRLLSLVLNKPLAWLYTNNQYQLTPLEKSKLEDLIKERNKGVPFAYLSGKQGFYHLEFFVNNKVLIPRPETENLIDVVKGLKLQHCKMLDLGTGSGIIAITLQSLFPNWQVFASDESLDALMVAKRNAITHQVIINFRQSDWFNEFTNEKFDLIISNPPYIDEKDEHLQTLQFEPQNALIAQDNGLSNIKHIIKSAPNFLNPKGFLILEHGYNQRKAIIKLLTKFSNIKTFNDLNAQHRIILAQLC